MSGHVFHPDLKIVPLSHVKLQEFVQKSRMHKLASAIKKEGILKNPPVVTNFFNSTYLHLDGANRLTAIDILGYPQCLVQVVDYSDSEHVHLTSWSHLLTMDKANFLSSVRAIDGVRIIEHKIFDHRLLLKPNVLCMVQFADKTIYEFDYKAAFTAFVTQMGHIVDLYGAHKVERVYSASPWHERSIHERFERFPEHTMFVAFPVFSPTQVMTLVDRGVLMPPGVTRHVVFRRKLNVNLPLEYLKISPTEKANEKLQKFLQHKTVRLYEGPVIFFE